MPWDATRPIGHQFLIHILRASMIVFVEWEPLYWRVFDRCSIPCWKHFLAYLLTATIHCLNPTQQLEGSFGFEQYCLFSTTKPKIKPTAPSAKTTKYSKRACTYLEPLPGMLFPSPRRTSSRGSGRYFLQLQWLLQWLAIMGSPQCNGSSDPIPPLIPCACVVPWL